MPGLKFSGSTTAESTYPERTGIYGRLRGWVPFYEIIQRRIEVSINIGLQRVS